VLKFVNKYFIAATVVLLLAGCSDPPKSIGIGLLDDDLIDVHKINSLDDTLAQSSSYFKRILNLGTAERFLLGKVNDIEASVLIRFQLIMADSIKNDLLNNNLTVTSAEIEMYQNYFYGDSLASFDFTVHKINSDWSVNFNIDSLQSLIIDTENMAGEKAVNDSVTKVMVDNQLVQSWLLAEADENLPTDKGVYLKPTGETGIVRGYQALTAAFTNTAVLKVVVEKTGVYTDTLSFIPFLDIGVIDGELPVISPENLAVQGGVAVNGRLFFDISKIPRTAVINNAELVFTIDTTETVLSPSAIQSIQAVMLLDSTNTDSLSSLASTLSRSENKLRGNVTSFVYGWFTGQNHGLVLRVFEQVNTLELFAIKGSNASDQSVRPYLEITYTNLK
jgi:hypothetical protein